VGDALRYRHGHYIIFPGVKVISWTLKNIQLELSTVQRALYDITDDASMMRCIRARASMCTEQRVRTVNLVAQQQVPHNEHNASHTDFQKRGTGFSTTIHTRVRARTHSPKYGKILYYNVPR
jgi:hypothetical protein